MLLSEFIKEFTQWSIGVHASATTKASDLALRKLLRFAGDVELSEIGPRDIDRFMSNCIANGNMKSSANNYHRHIKSALEKAVVWEIITDNPARKVKPLRQDKQPPKFIHPGKIGDFIDGIEDFDRRMLIAGYISTGRRRNELLSLKWEDIDFDGMKYLMNSTKAHTTRHYPIGDMFMGVLEQLADRYGMHGHVFSMWHSGDTVTHMAKEELRNGGYSDLHLHNFRHTFASALVISGVGLFTVKELLGHADIKTTQIYAHLTEQHLNEAVNKVQFNMGGLSAMVAA